MTADRPLPPLPEDAIEAATAAEYVDPTWGPSDPDWPDAYRRTKAQVYAALRVLADSHPEYPLTLLGEDRLVALVQAIDVSTPQWKIKNEPLALRPLLLAALAVSREGRG